MSGLLDRKTLQSLPLRSSSIYTEIKGFTARTTAILTYYNDNRQEIEGLFVLPLDHASAIVEFESIIEGHYIFADVKHNSELENKSILYKHEEMHDGIFNISIGKIPPWILIEVQVTVVSEVGVMFYGDALRYVLPQTFSPIVTSKEEENKVANQPEGTPSLAYSATSSLAYCFQLEIFIDAPCLLCGVQSNTHPIQVDAPPLSKTGSKLRVSLPDECEHTTNVFELLMFLCRPREPYILIEEAKVTSAEKLDDKNPISNIMNNPILMLSYSPDISNFQKELTGKTTNQVAEFLIIIDASTFHNSHIVHTIRARCTLFLRSLPDNCFFNITMFSSRCDPLFSSSQPYSRTNVKLAISYLNSIKASLDEPSFLHVFKWLYSQDAIYQTPKQAFMFSTGCMNTPNAVMELVRKKHHVARLFTFCIGSSENIRTFETISSLTKGQCHSVQEEERLNKKLMSCLKEALQPAVTNLKVSWILPDAYDVIYTPENLPCLFLGDRMNLYAILASKENGELEKRNDSVSSVKEFWIEDFDLFDEFNEQQCSSHDLLTDETTEINTPAKSEGVSTEPVASHTNHQETENEVFLTEEEAIQLKDNFTFQKRSSLDRIQTWRVSKNPDNDLDSDFNENDYGSDTERMYLQMSGYRKHKSSTDAESIGSSNSHSSNLSSSSHFLAFPGYPTRLNSVRSVEARSPHCPKYTDDQTMFTFNEQVSTEKFATDIKSNEKVSKQEAPRRKKITQALIDEHVNSHFIEQSNENVIERLLDGIVAEKRTILFDWVKLQEEMTQCTWPLPEHEKKPKLDKTDWRDSGLGHRSSSEPWTSDLEEDPNIPRKKSGQFSKSSSGYFDQEQENANTFVEKHIEDMSTKEQASDYKRTWIKRHSSSLSIDKENEHESLKKTYSDTKVHKKRLKPKQMWNAIIDKVKTLTTVVSERSGETNFIVRDNIKMPDSFTNFPDIGETNITDNRQSDSISTTEKSRDTVKSLSELSAQVESTEESRKGSKKQSKLHKRYQKNRPLIENSRTISTTSMFEIGQSEIGDVDNLHLLPSQALIYISGQFGQRSFKRIIPFQLVFGEGKSTPSNDVTVHQLAAKSIIRDLEIQMDQDEMLMLNSGRNYVKNLIADVSKSSHILSKYTAVVTMDEKAGEIISVLRDVDLDSSGSMKLSHEPFSISNDLKRSTEKLSKHEQTPMYEVKTEKLSNDSAVRRTKLTLMRPQYQSSRMKQNIQSKKSFTTKSTYMKLVDLMMTEGLWELSYLLAEALGINFSRLRESCPFADPLLKNKGGNQQHTSTVQQSMNDLYEQMWATSIALAWLHSQCMDLQNEWFLIESKARQWLLTQKLPKGFTLEDMIVLSQQTLKILKSSSRTASTNGSI